MEHTCGGKSQILVTQANEVADDSREWTKFGRYALLQKIGSGGMAEIYRAKTFGAAGFEKEFAIKLILPSLVDDTEFVEMFINEAKLAVNLYHANIVQVFDLGEINDQYYIAMEYVHGKDLLDVLARCAEMNIKIPLDLVLFIAQEMLKGLDFAHRATDQFGEPLNIIHRDVSPSNIMISYAGDVKVGDFGVAKAAIERTLTESGTLKGKVGYMSPEQVMGEEIDARSDIFAATIVLFEALSMNRLFVGDADLDVMLKVRDADIEESLRKAHPLPSGLIDILKRGLTKHREERFQTSGELYQALVDFCFQHDIKVTGSDLSAFMRRLFAEEIEEEKQQRKSEPSGEALSRQMAQVQQQEQPARVGSGVGPSGDQMPVGPGGDSQPERTPRTPSASAGGRHDTNQIDQPAPDTRRDVPQRNMVSGDGESEPQSPQRSSQESNYRYRDDSGLVFGPMGADTLVDLLRVRHPKRDDRISVDGGDWRRLDEVSELDLEEQLEFSDRSARADQKVRREINVDVSSVSNLEQQPVDPRNQTEDTDVMRNPPGAGITSPSKPKSEGDDESESDDQPKLAGVLHKAGESSVAEDDEDGGDDQPDSDDRQHKERTKSPVATEAPSAPAEIDPQDTSAADTLQELKDKYASYEGDLGDVSIARILGRLHLAEETGRLFVHRDGIEKSIFFRDGEPIFIESNREEELLGEFLRSRNVISQQQLDDALERLDEWGGRLGDALVAIGAIPAHSLFEHLTEQMREKLLEIFSWDTGRYSYYENQEPESQAYSLGLETYETIVEGCRDRVDLERIQDTYQNRMFVSIYRSEPPPFEIDRLGLRTVEMRVVNNLESGTNLEHLLDEFPRKQHETVYRTVYLLHQVEIFSFEVTGRVDLPPVPD